MTIKAQVNAGLFELVSRAASKEETRYYLKGVFLCQRPGLEGVMMVATDGHRMMVAHDPHGVLHGDPIIVGTVDSKELVKACKVTKAGSVKTLSICEDMINWTVREDSGGLLSGMVKIIDGTFPDWERVVPKDIHANKERPTSAYLDPKYVEVFGKIGVDLSKILGHNVATSFCGYDGSSPQLVSFCEARADNVRLFGVLMPIRVSAELGTLPDFMETKPVPEELEAA